MQEPSPKKTLNSVAGVIATTVKVKAIETRTNWSKGDDKKRMDLAIGDWLEKTGDALNASGNKIIHMETFCCIIQITSNTFQKYVRINPNNRRKIKHGVGTEPLLSTSDLKFIADTIVRHDWSNNGLSCNAVIERMMDIKPGITKEQAKNHLHHTMKNNHSDILKKHVVVG